MAVIRSVGAQSAFVETRARPPLGSPVTIRHPHAGEVRGLVDSHAVDGIRISLPNALEAIEFALAAVAADSSRP